MIKILLGAWNTVWAEIDRALPELFSIHKNFYSDMLSNWWRMLTLETTPPYRPWIIGKGLDFVNANLDWIQDLLGLLPGLVLTHVVLSNVSISPKLRQRVMTLDQAALLPARVIIDLGIRKSQESLPREFLIATRVTKFEKLLQGKWKSYFFGSIWGRVVTVVGLAVKWGAVMGYVVLLYRYFEQIERDPDSLIFNAKLSNKNPRENQRVRIRRRIGGVHEPRVSLPARRGSGVKLTQSF